MIIRISLYEFRCDSRPLDYVPRLNSVESVDRVATDLLTEVTLPTAVVDVSVVISDAAHIKLNANISIVKEGGWNMENVDLAHIMK